MTTYTITEAQRHQLLDAVTASELDDVREVAEKMLQSLAPMAVPSTSPTDALKADNERLRAALKELRKLSDGRDIYLGSPPTQSLQEKRLQIIDAAIKRG